MCKRLCIRLLLFFFSAAISSPIIAKPWVKFKTMGFINQSTFYISFSLTLNANDTVRLIPSRFKDDKSSVRTADVKCRFSYPETGLKTLMLPEKIILKDQNGDLSLVTEKELITGITPFSNLEALFSIPFPSDEIEISIAGVVERFAFQYNGKVLENSAASISDSAVTSAIHFFTLMRKKDPELGTQMEKFVETMIALAGNSPYASTNQESFQFLKTALQFSNASNIKHNKLNEALSNLLMSQAEDFRINNMFADEYNIYNLASGISNQNYSALRIDTFKSERRTAYLTTLLAGFPGGFSFYNKEYTKGVVYLSLFGTAVYFASNYAKKAKDNNALSESYSKLIMKAESFEEQLGYSTLASHYSTESRNNKKNMKLLLIAAGGVVLTGIIEAIHKTYKAYSPTGASQYFDLSLSGPQNNVMLNASMAF